MKRFVYFALLFLFVLAISVIAHLPASFVYNQMPKIRGLDVSGISGTVWQGQVDDVRWQGANAGQVRWDFSALKLFQGKAEYSLRFGKGSDFELTGTGVAGYSLQGAYIHNLLASMPVGTLTERVVFPVPVEAKGTLELTLRNYVYAEPWCTQAEGALVWNGSQIVSPIGTLDLGTIFTDFTCNASRIELKGDHDAPAASGSVSTELTPNRQYTLSAWFKPGAELPDSMSSQLKWLGNPDNDGRYVFELSGKL